MCLYFFAMEGEGEASNHKAEQFQGVIEKIDRSLLIYFVHRHNHIGKKSKENKGRAKRGRKRRGPRESPITLKEKSTGAARGRTVPSHV